MSRPPATGCPDWPALVAAREAGRAAAGWRAALAHREGCADCARRSLAADPLLLFQALPRVEVAAGEVEAMKQAVASLRRAQRVAPEVATAAPAASAASRGRLRRAAGRLPLARRLRGLAAAALLAAAGAALWVADPATEPPAARVEAVPVPAPAAPVLPAAVTPSAEEPVFMDLSRPSAADVYRLGNGGVQVVMVVDETLDV